MKEKVVEWLNVLMGFRKFLAWFSLFIVGIVFRIDNMISGEQFVDLVKATFAGLVAGNMTEHLVSFGKDYMASKTSKTPDPAPTDDGNKEVTPVVEEGS